MITERTIRTEELKINYAVAGDGPPLVLLHGFPHTWRIWSLIMPALAENHRVIAPDLRGFGDTVDPETGRAPDNGYDAASLVHDLGGLLDALQVTEVSVIAMDAAVAPAFLLALQQPERVRRLVLIEGTLGQLPGAEEFFGGGAPWWFGFHAVAGLAERVLSGNEAAYVDWFLQVGTRGTGVPGDIREPILRSYARPGALGGPLAYYRALPESSRQLVEATTIGRLRTPTLAIGAQTVGAALAGQLTPVTDELTAVLIEDCGHIVPVDRPEELLRSVEPFLAGSQDPDSSAAR